MLCKKWTLDSVRSTTVTIIVRFEDFWPAFQNSEESLANKWTQGCVRCCLKIENLQSSRAKLKFFNPGLLSHKILAASVKSRGCSMYSRASSYIDRDEELSSSSARKLRFLPKEGKCRGRLSQVCAWGGRCRESRKP